MRPQDGCGGCVTADDFVVVAPLSVRREPGSLVCAYRCPRCGHSWVTSWNMAALGGAA